ncbi:hypothetical protein F4703DRAFT_1598226 [Phycomyces blakesleeanus]
MITSSPTTTTDAVVIQPPNLWEKSEPSSDETPKETIPESTIVNHTIESVSSSHRQVRPPTALEVATRNHVMRNTFSQDHRTSFDMSNLAMIPFQPYSKWPFTQYQQMSDRPLSESMVTSRRTTTPLTTATATTTETTIVDDETDLLDQMSLLTNQTSPASSAATLPKSISQSSLDDYPLSRHDNQKQSSQHLVVVPTPQIYEDTASTHSPRHPKLPESPIWTPTPSKRRDDGNRDDSERHTHRRIGFHQTRHAFEPIDAPLPVFQLDTVPHYASISLSPWITTNLHSDIITSYNHSHSHNNHNNISSSSSNISPSAPSTLPAPPAEPPRATDSFTTALFRQFYQKPSPPPPPATTTTTTSFNDTNHSPIVVRHNATIATTATSHSTVSATPDPLPAKKSPVVRFSFWSQKKPAEEDKEKRIEEIVSLVNPSTNNSNSTSNNNNSNGATGSGRVNNEGYITFSLKN